MDNKALFKLGYGLYILTSQAAGKNHGCVVNTVMQITSSPLQLLVGVNKNNATHDALMTSGICNISVLDDTAPFTLFEHFGFQTGKTVDKFADWSQSKTSANGLPYLTEHTNAYLSGKVTSTTDYGTHTLFTVEITDAEILADTASLTYAEYHAKVKPKPAAETTDTKPKGYRCIICGYIYPEDKFPSDDFVCPICKHGIIDFEKL